MTRASPPRPGAMIGGRYKLLGVIGTGGIGIVYEAEDVAERKRVAVKMLRAELLTSGPFVERLRREARVVSSLKHPNVVEVLSVNVTAEEAYLVMELLEGTSFGALLRDSGPLDGRAVAEIGTGIFAGLVAAHEAGLVHRDVKPDNVFLATTPHGEVVKILDFGLVKSVDDPQPLTATGTVLGTLQYMPPEQAHGHPVDSAADVYSAGACLYYALTGKRPYQAADMEASMFALSDMPAPAIRTMRSDVDAELCDAIERALAKPHAARPTAQDLLATLRRWAPPASSERVAINSSITKLRAIPAPVASGREPTTERDGEEFAASVPTKEEAPASTLSSPDGKIVRDVTAPFAGAPVRREEVVAPHTVPLPPNLRAKTPKASTAQRSDARSASKRPPAPARHIDVRITVLFVLAFVLFGVGLLVGRAFVFR